MLDSRTILVLIGLRGSGKTSVARALGALLGREWADLDDLSPKFLGRTSAGEAIRMHGERAFRRAELAAMVEAMKEPGRVLALGGGTPIAPGVEEMLMGARKQGTARVAYLRASERTLRARLAAEGGDRPTLTGAGALEEIGVLLNLRDTLYTSLADVVVDVNGMDIEQVAKEIVARLG